MRKTQTVPATEIYKILEGFIHDYGRLPLVNDRLSCGPDVTSLAHLNVLFDRELVTGLEEVLVDPDLPVFNLRDFLLGTGLGEIDLDRDGQRLRAALPAPVEEKSAPAPSIEAAPAPAPASAERQEPDRLRLLLDYIRAAQPVRTFNVGPTPGSISLIAFGTAARPASAPVRQEPLAIEGNRLQRRTHDARERHRKP